MDIPRSFSRHKTVIGQHTWHEPLDADFLATSYLQRRFGLSRSVAATIAALANLGSRQ